MDGLLLDGFGSRFLGRGTPAEEKAALLTQEGLQFVFIVGDGGKEMLDVVTGVCKDVFVALPAGWLRDEVDPVYATAIGLARYSIEVLIGYHSVDDMASHNHQRDEL